MPKYTIHNSLGGEVGFVDLVEDHKHDPLVAYGQKVGLSSAEVKAAGITAKPYPEPMPELNAAQRMLIARGEMNERLYLRMEEVLQPPEPTADMLERMNLCMGFPTSVPHAKDKDYRPYCLADSCKSMPRMMRHEHGFMCWDCRNIWDLRLICKHPHPNGSGEPCGSDELERMPVGYRCRKCAGMHHLTGRAKGRDSIALCDLDCCCAPGFKENVRRERDDPGWHVHCRKGLWGVSAPDLKEAMREAKHYYQQYHADGEYDA